MTESLGALLRAQVGHGAALFDLDGTLVDSVADISAAINALLREESLAEVSVSKVETLTRYPIDQILDRVGVRGDIGDAVVRFRAHLVEVMGTHSTVFPGVFDVLGLLRERGWALGVATNKPTYMARLALERAGLASRFVAVVGAESLPAKPEPHILLACLDELACAGGFMVGDTVLDIAAGRAAGLATIGIASRIEVREDLHHAGADLVLRSMTELFETLG